MSAVQSVHARVGMWRVSLSEGDRALEASLSLLWEGFSATYIAVYH